MQSDHIKGLIFAFAGFSLLSVGDAVIKSIHGAWPGTAIAALRYSFGALGLGAMLWRKDGRKAFRLPMPWVQLGRGASVAFASASFFIGLFLMPLAEATVIQFASPILTALLSALILKEAAPRAAWVATMLAFLGVLIVLRPNIAALGPAALLPLCCALGMALMMVFNRMAAGAASVLAMQFMISAIASPLLIGAAIAGHFSGIAALAVSLPAPSIVLRCGIVAVSASGAHALIYLATMRASAALIAPMTYVQLLVAVTLGAIVFGNTPDTATLAGAALIIGGGLYLWRSQRGGD
jgi:drug/metabolite transporter (DMT)-like permease